MSGAFGLVMDGIKASPVVCASALSGLGFGSPRPGVTALWALFGNHGGALGARHQRDQRAKPAAAAAAATARPFGAWRRPLHGGDLCGSQARRTPRGAQLPFSKDVAESWTHSHLAAAALDGRPNCAAPQREEEEMP